MRLLNSCTLEIKDFVAEDIPPEVEVMRGYRKIMYCCLQAAENGIEWIWIDTCCIDKASSAELSEAINSMFRWYRDATVCYAYLYDVPRGASHSAIEKHLSRSRWFTRGWTLQELIAPSNLVLYSRDWHRLGTKKSLCQLISRITGIDQTFLDGENLDAASVAKKMSWAANRETTRTENIVYCLLGIFHVYMPLLYGEGKQAFQRLQHEIMKAYPQDHTLFAWGVVVDQPSMCLPDGYGLQGPKTLPPWRAEMIREPLLGLLAQSPKEFEFSFSFSPLPVASAYYRDANPVLMPTQVGKEIRFDLPGAGNGLSVYHRPQPKIASLVNFKRVVLLCGDDSNNILSIFLYLYAWGDLCWGRTRELTIGRDAGTYTSLRMSTICVHIESEQQLQLKKGDFIERQHRFDSSRWNCYYLLSSAARTYSLRNEQVTRAARDSECMWSFLYLPKEKENARGFAILFGRVECEDVRAGAVKIGFMPIMRGMKTLWTDMGGILWWRDAPLDDIAPFCDFLRTSKGGTWTLDFLSFPLIRIQLERMTLDEEGNVVEVLDVFVDNRTRNNSPIFYEAIFVPGSRMANEISDGRGGYGVSESL